MKNILVTGCSGFIGHNLCLSLLNESLNVIGLDRNENKISHRNFKFYHADILDYQALEAVFKNNDIGTIIHLSGVSDIRSIKMEEIFLDVNINGTLNILELSRKYGIKKFIFASSSSVYGAGNIPFKESDNTEKPLSIYAFSKKSCELLLFYYSGVYGINTMCLRFFTVYGEGGRKDMAIYKFTDKINNSEPIEIFGKGDQKRDYVHVDDVVSAIRKSIDKNFDYDIINIGTGRALETKKIIELICKELGKKAKIIYKEEPKNEMKATQADIQKAKDVLNWQPRITIEDGIKRFVKWYKSQNQGCL